MHSALIKTNGLNQVGLVVRNLEKTVKDYWKLLGIGPHIIIAVEPVEGYAMTYAGKPAAFKFKASFCRVGSVELEFLQSVEGPNLYEDHLKAHGEGANHLQSLAKSVAEVNSHIDTMSQNGFPLLMGGHYDDEVGFGYIDTVSSLKTIWEVVKMPENPLDVPVIYPPDDLEACPAKIRIDAIQRIGIVVEDLEKTMQSYETIMGIGPWDVREMASPDIHDLTFRGQQSGASWKVATATAGSVNLKLVQPLSGPSIFTEFLQAHGEGIHHLQFLVDDIDGTNRVMKAQGFPVLMEGESSEGGFAFYDTLNPLKIIWEAFQPA